jgi:peptidoglycan/LPS O-acetylase OafA/YrhL
MLNQEVLYRYTPFRIDALLLGGCIALIRRGPSRETLLTAARVGFALLSTVLLFWLALNPTARGNLTKYVYPAWDFTWGLSFIDAYAACLLVMSLESTSIAFRILNLRPLRWLGRISYGAYVFHEIFHPEFAHLFRNYSTKHATLLTAILALAFTLLAAWVSFRYFETPFIRLKERWTGRSSTVRNESVTIA